MKFSSFFVILIGYIICSMVIIYISRQEIEKPVTSHINDVPEPIPKPRVLCVEGYKFVDDRQLIDRSGNGIECDPESQR